MVDKPLFNNGGSVIIGYDSDNKIQKINKSNTISYRGEIKYNDNKLITSKLISGSNESVNSAIKSMLSNRSLYEDVVQSNEEKCKSLESVGLIKKDLAADDIYNAIKFTFYSPKGSPNDISCISIAVNNGYALNLDYVYKYFSSIGKDLKKNVEKLFADSKAYWNLKRTNDKPDAIESLEKSVKLADNELEEYRQDLWKLVLKSNGSFSYGHHCTFIDPLNENNRDIVFMNDIWFSFLLNVSAMQLTSKGIFDSVSEFELRSLMSDFFKKRTGEIYPFFYYINYYVDKKFLGGYKFTRANGRQF